MVGDKYSFEEKQLLFYLPIHSGEWIWICRILIVCQPRVGSEGTEVCQDSLFLTGSHGFMRTIEKNLLWL